MVARACDVGVAGAQRQTRVARFFQVGLNTEVAETVKGCDGNVSCPDRLVEDKVWAPEGTSKCCSNDGLFTLGGKADQQELVVDLQQQDASTAITLCSGTWSLQALVHVGVSVEHFLMQAS